MQKSVEWSFLVELPRGLNEWSCSWDKILVCETATYQSLQGTSFSCLSICVLPTVFQGWSSHPFSLFLLAVGFILGTLTSVAWALGGSLKLQKYHTTVPAAYTVAHHVISVQKGAHHRQRWMPAILKWLMARATQFVTRHSYWEELPC